MVNSIVVSLKMRAKDYVRIVKDPAFVSLWCLQLTVTPWCAFFDINTVTYVTTLGAHLPTLKDFAF